MNTRQTIAYLNPCARAVETLEPRFQFFERRSGFVFSVLLTVNK